jgi:hypothetical protein
MSKLLVTIDGTEFEVEVTGASSDDGFVLVTVNGEQMQVALSSLGAPETIEWAMVDTRPHELVVDHSLRWIQSARGRHTVQVRDLEGAGVLGCWGEGVGVKGC